MSETVTKTMDELIREITEERLQQPHMAREDVLGEAREFLITITRDKAELETKGDVADIIDSYGSRIDTCDKAGSAFNTSLFDKHENRKNWDVVEPGAYDFKWFLLEELDFCFENLASEKKYVKEIRKGRGRRDLVCDYGDISALIAKNRLYLEANYFDFSYETKCNEDGAVLAELLSKMVTSPEHVEEEKQFYYKAYTYLNEATQKLRRIGQHLYRRDLEKLEEYKSDHYKSIGALNTGSTTAE